MKIKIIKDSPACGQDSIKNLIGETFDAVSVDNGENLTKFGYTEDCVRIFDASSGLSIILNREEYEVVED